MLERPAGRRPGLLAFFDDWLYSGLILLACLVCLARTATVPAERPAWFAMSAALCSWTAGDLYYTYTFNGRANVPFPS